MRDWFRNFAHKSAEMLGSPAAFAGGVLLIVLWAASGPAFQFSDTWQLVINTGTTVITFLMVFLIQTTQNRDARAVHLKLDELIRAVTAARTNLVHLEDLTDDELAKLEREFRRLQEKMQQKKAKEGPIPENA